jgi:hypothetical protein
MPGTNTPAYSVTAPTTKKNVLYMIGTSLSKILSENEGSCLELEENEDSESDKMALGRKFEK